MNRAILEAMHYERLFADDFASVVWKEISCEESEAMRRDENVCVHVLSGCHDIHGEFGAPSSFTLWGDANEMPILSNFADYDRNARIEKCYHAKRIGSLEEE